MIRDPSDGSVMPDMTNWKQVAFENVPEPLRSKYGPNWGLKSLDEPKRKPTPAPTREELEAHYREFNLGFRPKQEGQ